ncbi:MAG TPA: histidinol dehydrogenase [Conexibacter sp.]|nr:histidinol dehydrogenase [Conexibacter sp.]
MRLDRRTLARTEDAAAVLAAELRRLAPGGESVAEAVDEILTLVRWEGDDAVQRLTRRYDTHGAEPMPLRVEPAELTAALAALDPAVRAGLELAIENVRTVAEAGLDEDQEVALPQGQRVVLRELPVARAAVYVPGGRAPYPSTVVMGVVTAHAAGVKEIVVCAPPGADGDVHAAILAACALAGADEVYRSGGAQAIGALAYGTETVEPVDVIVGPGSLYVQEAKRQVSHRVGIDGFAGPSDLLVVLGGDVGGDVELAALDLRAQAEHGTGSLVVAASPDAAVLDALAPALENAPEGAPAALVRCEGIEAALELAEAFAPEHLQLIGAEAEALASRVTRAGCLFVGAGAATAFGDYLAGSNHVLPTDGAARFASGLSARTFRRRMAELRIDAAAAAALAGPGAAIARAEGFETHATSMEARIRENGAR